jgi:hypothetical protein
MSDVTSRYLEKNIMSNLLRISVFFLFVTGITLLIGCGPDLSRELGAAENELKNVKSELNNVKRKLQSTEKELSKWDGFDQLRADSLEYQKKQKHCREVAIQRDKITKKMNSIENKYAELAKLNNAINAESKNHIKLFNQASESLKQVKKRLNTIDSEYKQKLDILKTQATKVETHYKELLSKVNDKTLSAFREVEFTDEDIKIASDMQMTYVSSNVAKSIEFKCNSRWLFGATKVYIKAGHEIFKPSKAKLNPKTWRVQLTFSHGVSKFADALAYTRTDQIELVIVKPLNTLKLRFKKMGSVTKVTYQKQTDPSLVKSVMKYIDNSGDKKTLRHTITKFALIRINTEGSSIFKRKDGKWVISGA